MSTKLQQKLLGLLVIAIGIICPVIEAEAGTIAVLFVPLGLWLLFSKEDLLS